MSNAHITIAVTTNPSTTALPAEAMAVERMDINALIVCTQPVSVSSAELAYHEEQRGICEQRVLVEAPLEGAEVAKRESVRGVDKERAKDLCH